MGALHDAVGAIVVVLRRAFPSGRIGHRVGTSDNIREPKIDPDPDPGNEAGGVDAVEEIKEPEEPDTEANLDDPSAEPSA